MKKYEIMYIVRPNLEDEARKSLIESFARIFTKMGAKTVEVKELGMKVLAYEINDHVKGFYVVMNVEAPHEACDEFDRLVKINEDVMRHIVVKAEEIIPVPAKPKSKPAPKKVARPVEAKEEAKKERAAE